MKERACLGCGKVAVYGSRRPMTYPLCGVCNSGVYALEDAGGRVRYVGHSRDIAKRMHGHLHSGLSLRKQGWLRSSRHKLVVLEACRPETGTLREAELRWIAALEMAGEPLDLMLDDGPSCDLAGSRFGAWEVLERSTPEGPRSKARWKCRCECGRERDVAYSNLRSGHSKSCGCAKRRKA